MWDPMKQPVLSRLSRTGVSQLMHNIAQLCFRVCLISRIVWVLCCGFLTFSSQSSKFAQLQPTHCPSQLFIPLPGDSSRPFAVGNSSLCLLNLLFSILCSIPQQDHTHTHEPAPREPHQSYLITKVSLCISSIIPHISSPYHLFLFSESGTTTLSENLASHGHNAIAAFGSAE